ncbi:MAG: protein-disulfide reductase DsbD family protein [Pyrinomonadaceae bacterium]
MLKKVVFVFVATAFLAVTAFAQNPTDWQLKVQPALGNIESGEKFEADLFVKIDKGWHLYSQSQKKGGPIATTIKPATPDKYSISGEIETPKPQVEFDKNFGIETSFFVDEANFKIPLTATAEMNAAETGIDVRFQLCNDSFCLPPKTLRVTLTGSEQIKPISKQLSSNPAKKGAYIKFGQGETQDQPVWSFLWLAISLGALSLLTPCVFPMIPITVSYFTKNSGGSKGKSLTLALVYSLGIIATFTLLGMLLAVFVGASGINLFAANPWINLLIAAVFLLFGLNLLGFFEITIPSELITKLDALTRTKEGEGSAYVGALLMGLTFTITSFTCTSPFVGTILVSTSQGNWKMPLLGMLAFSTVFALPFFILALAPQLISQLPRSGGWLNSVKVVMGFLELAAALKFISNIDLVWSSGFKTAENAVNYGFIFTREVVLALWILIAFAIVLYILGVIRVKTDVKKQRITPARMIFAAIFAAFGIYLALGLFGMRLGELESFLPPKNPDSKLNILGDKKTELVWIKNDLPKALELAKRENKRVFIDFTGYTCTNCRWMEANMFPREDVKAEMKDFVLVSLYTDGDGEVYARQQQYQEETFETVALPFYAVLNSDGTPYSTFPGLTRSSVEFIDFLYKSK